MGRTRHVAGTEWSAVVVLSDSSGARVTGAAAGIVTKVSGGVRGSAYSNQADAITVTEVDSVNNPGVYQVKHTWASGLAGSVRDVEVSHPTYLPYGVTFGIDLETYDADGLATGIGASFGAHAWTLTTQEADTTPITGVDVSLRDATDTNRMYRATTDSNGQIVFNLDDGTYYVHLAKEGVTWDFPVKSFTISGGDAAMTRTGALFSPPVPGGGSTVLFFGFAQDVHGAALVGEKVLVRADSDLVIGGKGVAVKELSLTTDANGYFQYAVVKDASSGATVRQTIEALGLFDVSLPVSAWDLTATSYDTLTDTWA